MKTPTLFSVALFLSLSIPNTVLGCQPPDPQVMEQHRQMNRHILKMNPHRRRQSPPIAAAAASGGSSGAPAPPASSQPPAKPSPSAPAAPAPSSPNSPAAPASSAPAVPSPPPQVPSDPFAVIPLSEIVSGAPPEVTPPLFFTPQAGAKSPVAGAPPLPALSLNPANYPPLEKVPPVDSPQVAEWMKEIQGIDPNILNIRPTVDGSCANDTAAAADLSRCWWTCGGCTNATDVVTCPDKNTWGVSFDDGPAPYSPKVLKFLNDKKLSATFFVIGSRVMSNPVTLQAEYMLGHHISVHTWSHSIPLTALSNEQVVAELGWARAVIRDVIGVTPLTMRPPWGDIDNRVRAISLAMGMTPIIWTRQPQTLEQFDTNDWRVVAGQVTGTDSVAQFQSILTNATTLNTGFIVLEHDLWQQEVDLSTGYFIPEALSKQFNLMDINTCHHLPNTEAYLETIVNKSAIPTYPGAGTVDVAGNGTSNGGNPSAQAPSGGSSGSSSGAAIVTKVSISMVLGAGLLGAIATLL